MFRFFDAIAGQLDWLAVLAGLICCLAIAGAIYLYFRARVALQREETSRKQNQLFESALNNMSQGLLMFDADDQLILFNQRYAELYKLDPASVRLGSSFAEQFRLRKQSGTFAPDLDRYLARVTDEAGR